MRPLCRILTPRRFWRSWVDGTTSHSESLCVCVCVCVRARARVCEVWATPAHCSSWVKGLFKGCSLSTLSAGTECGCASQVQLVRPSLDVQWSGAVPEHDFRGGVGQHRVPPVSAPRLPCTTTITHTHTDTHVHAVRWHYYGFDAHMHACTCCTYCTFALLWFRKLFMLPLHALICGIFADNSRYDWAYDVPMQIYVYIPVYILPYNHTQPYPCCTPCAPWRCPHGDVGVHPVRPCMGRTDAPRARQCPRLEYNHTTE